MDSTAIATHLIDERAWVSQPAVSPDGSQVAFVVATTDLEKNKTFTRVWLDNAPISAGDHDGNPTWSPDGRSLAFTSRRGEKKGDSTLHVLAIDRPGETRTLCTMADGLTDVTWSPDGNLIGFTSRTRSDRYDIEEVARQPPRKIEELFSRLNGEDWIYDRPSHVYVVPADGTGNPRNLTPGNFQHSGVSWTADSSSVATSAARHEGWARDLATDIYLIPINDPDDIRCLTAHDGTYSLPSVSPDGSLVAFNGTGELDTYPQNSMIGVLPIDATGAAFDDITWISSALDRTFFAMTCPHAVVWENDGSILSAVEDRGETHLYRLAADGSQPPSQVTEGALSVQGFDSANGVIATVAGSTTSVGELFVDGKQQTNVGGRLSSTLLPWQKYAVATADGTDEIDCWVMRPAEFDDTQTYPVLLNVHGGPFTQYGEFFMDEFQMQAAAGFVVILGNPRGGSGRHTEWGQAILGPAHPLRPGSGWGGLDVDDVMAILTGSLAKFDFCDPNRVGMLGGSYGGFMATWLAAHHGDHFRAFCSERAVNNLVSEEWNSDIATAFRTEHGPSHIENPDVYRASSPIESVRNIDKPMLIIHSEEDWRCPIVQAEELWVALTLLDRDVDFYRFPGENHELSRSGSPVHRVQRAEIILDWFAEKLS